jgi:V8-like Glu-specific endopeptidase
MKLWMPIILLACLVLPQAFSSEDKVVYGEDDRLDIHEVKDALYLDLATSTAAMIPPSALTKTGSKMVIKGSTLEDRGICKSAKFSQQITAAFCSGFLVGPDLLVTAGHCVKNNSDCRKFRWVFGYGIEDKKKTTFEVDSDDVYSCSKVISQSLDNRTSDDFALIKLDREVTGRTPLEVRTKGKIEKGTEILVIGHPTGLPTKVAAGARVRKNNKMTYFSSNLDTFGGNSGSAVFDAETGVVEGILVRGETDYVYNRELGCRVPKVCTDTGCRGEDVTRITNIKKLMEILAE